MQLTMMRRSRESLRLSSLSDKCFRVDIEGVVHLDRSNDTTRDVHSKLAGWYYFCVSLG